MNKSCDIQEFRDPIENTNKDCLILRYRAVYGCLDCTVGKFCVVNVKVLVPWSEKIYLLWKEDEVAEKEKKINLLPWLQGSYFL